MREVFISLVDDPIRKRNRRPYRPKGLDLLDLPLSNAIPIGSAAGRPRVAFRKL
jgi:hypothetical protein